MRAACNWLLLLLLLCETAILNIRTSLTSSLSCLALAVGMLLSLNLQASEKMAQEIAERTKPVGAVCIEGEPCAAQAASAAKPSGPRSGEAIYSASCTSCHAAGVAGAPIFGDVAQWAPRIAKGVETLYANSINGINAMPPKGLCMDCSDEEIQATVDYMLDAAR